MNCICGSQTKPGTVEMDYRGHHFKDVPVGICESCGEEIMSSDTLKELDKIIDAEAK